MGEVVNLRSARKRRQKEREKATADAQRAIYGRTKEQETIEDARAEKLKRDLEAHFREREPEEKKT